MLCGSPPFNGKTDNEICKLILQGEVPYPEKKWSSISHSAKDLLKTMLTVNV